SAKRCRTGAAFFTTRSQFFRECGFDLPRLPSTPVFHGVNRTLPNQVRELAAFQKARAVGPVTSTLLPADTRHSTCTGSARHENRNPGPGFSPPSGAQTRAAVCRRKEPAAPARQIQNGAVRGGTHWHRQIG